MDFLFMSQDIDEMDRLMGLNEYGDDKDFFLLSDQPPIIPKHVEDELFEKINAELQKEATDKIIDKVYEKDKNEKGRIVISQCSVMCKQHGKPKAELVQCKYKSTNYYNGKPMCTRHINKLKNIQ